MYRYILFFCLSFSLLNAAPAFSKTRQFRQSSGESFSAKVMGDEHLNYILTNDNEVVVFNKESNNYDYAIIAKKNNQRYLAPSGFKVMKASSNSKSRSNPFKRITPKELQELYNERRQTPQYIPTH